MMTHRMTWLHSNVLLAAAPESIPDLRPPENVLPPSFWEQHGGLMVVGGVLLLTVAIVGFWCFRRRTQSATPSPLSIAREGLLQLANQPGSDVVAGQVGGLLRRYLVASFKTLPPAELTADELAARLPRVAPWLGAELLGQVTSLLTECDRLKYAHPPGPVPNPAQRAVELLERVASVQAAEQRRVPPVLSAMKPEPGRP